jgi:hypothetical protein
LKCWGLERLESGATVTVSSLQVNAKPRSSLENELFRVELNPETGYIARLYNKENKREAFRGEDNFLVAQEDTAERAKEIREPPLRACGHSPRSGTLRLFTPLVGLATVIFRTPLSHDFRSRCSLFPIQKWLSCFIPLA